MAAPEDVNIKDLNGQWSMNKTLSDDSDPLLALQGISWFTRKIIQMSSVTLDVTQTLDPAASEDGFIHISIVQTLSGGLAGTTENRVLDWTAREHEDHIFGKVSGRSRFTSVDGLEGDKDDFLKTGWREESLAPDGVVESVVDSLTDEWSARQIWGFEDVEDARRYVRHVVVAKGEEKREARLVYDFVKKREEEEAETVTAAAATTE
ncbi:MAG: hypothetical protein M1825_002927 [Sarcosagium campestre]|nr:MAG: hypothetical protein M1825_002927 [Sarcosagium campestre]